MYLVNIVDHTINEENDTKYIADTNVGAHYIPTHNVQHRRSML